MHSRNHTYSSSRPSDSETIEGLSVRTLWGVKKRFHKCPRCHAITSYVGTDPYCMNCNWDSLTDVSFGKRPRSA